MSKNLLEEFLQEATRDFEERQKALEARLSELPVPDKQVVEDMLNDVEAVTKGRFYEDPDPIASPVEMFLVRDGKRKGEPFSALMSREKFQVLDDYSRCSFHEGRGISFEALDLVFRNVVGGKPRDKWLEHTGLERAFHSMPERSPDESRGR